MGGAPQGRGKTVASINVTPLVDVVLVLLIIFMVTTTVMDRKAVTVELPKAASGDDLKSVPLVVVVQKDRTVSVSGSPVTLEALAVLAKAPDPASGKPPDKAVVAADKGVDYGRVTEVIDTLRLSGIASFALEIRPVEAAPAGAP